MIYSIAVREGGAAEYEAVKQIYLTTTSTDGKPICLHAMGITRDPTLITDYLNFIFSHSVSIQDTHAGASTLSGSPLRRRMLWNFIKANFDGIITERLGGNKILVERFLRLSLGKFTDKETEREISAFFESRDTRGYDRGLEVAKDSIRMRCGYRARDRDVLGEWLSVKGYMSDDGKGVVKASI